MGDMGDINARLLPWSSPEGKPCFVLGDGSGYVSRLADEVEAAHLGLAAERIEEARRVLEDGAGPPGNCTCWPLS